MVGNGKKLWPDLDSLQKEKLGVGLYTSMPYLSRQFIRKNALLGRLSSNAETFISVPLVTFSSPDLVIWEIEDPQEGSCQPYLVYKPK